MNELKLVINILTKKERKKSILLIVLMFIMAMLDALGVASIAPFIALIVNPENVERSKYLFWIASKMPKTDGKELVVILGWMFLILLTLSIAFKAVVTYLQLRFVLMMERSISTKLIDQYLHNSYEWFVEQNSSALGKNILSEINFLVHQSILPAFTLVAQIFVVLALMSLIIVINPRLALIVGASLGSLYIIVYIFINKLLVNIGVGREKSNEKRFKIVDEVFGAFKEIKIFNLENKYKENYDYAAKEYATKQAASSTIIQLPRFILEIVAFGGLLLIILNMMESGEDISSALPAVTMYAFAGYRLMPALQQVFQSISQLKYSSRAVGKLCNEFKMEKISRLDSQKTKKISFEKKINFVDIEYKYKTSKKKIIKKLNMEINVKKTTALVGPSGGGKSTIIDILLGVLRPNGGCIKIDDEEINEENILDWQKKIGYVPQQIYLKDASVFENIAFGVEVKDIDRELVRHAAILANANDFIELELANGYETNVGDKGILLSGGQKQRLAIARALYRNPEILILDEATSALDSISERLVMNAIANLSKKMTIIIIAHRLSTIKECDCIYVISNGVVSGKGTFNQLSLENEEFKNMLLENKRTK